MDILTCGRFVGQPNLRPSTFSLVGLPPFTSIPFASAILSLPSDFPEDLLCLSAVAAANDFILHSEEDEEGEADGPDGSDGPARSGDLSDSWPAYTLPMGGHSFSADAPVVDRTDRSDHATHTDAFDPIDTLDFISVDSDYVPTLGDEAYHLAYSLEASGIAAVPPAEISRDPEAGLRWSRGKHAGKAARLAKLADLAIYSQGQAAGHAGAEPIPPRGMSPREAAIYLAGLDAGADIRFREVCDASDMWDSLDGYGRQVVSAIAEDGEDRREFNFLA